MGRSGLRMGRSTLSGILYIVVVLFMVSLVGLSCVFLLSQAVRTSPKRSWKNNFNTVVISASYFTVLIASIFFSLKRRISIRRRLQKITKHRSLLGKGDVPKSVHEFITQEYARVCLIAHESEPTDAFHEGWGRPDSEHYGICFREALLDTVPTVDEAARGILPHLPPITPHTRILHHLRYLILLFQDEPEGLTPVHVYDAAIQLARASSREPTEEEFERGVQAAERIVRTAHEMRNEMGVPDWDEVSRKSAKSESQLLSDH